MNVQFMVTGRTVAVNHYLIDRSINLRYTSHDLATEDTADLMTKPSTRPSADATRTAILNNAKKLFVKNGFAGTSISEIAKAAGINQSLIYHHFKNKEDLWISVKAATRDQYVHNKQYHEESLFAINNARDFIAAIVSFRFDIYDVNPEIRRMLDWQYLEPSSERLIGMSMDFINEIKAKLQSFQEQGQIVSKADPDLLFTLILGVPSCFWRSHKDLEKTVPKSQLSEFKGQYLQLCIDTLVSGLVDKKAVAISDK